MHEFVPNIPKLLKPLLMNLFLLFLLRLDLLYVLHFFEKPLLVLVLQEAQLLDCLLPVHSRQTPLYDVLNVHLCKAELGHFF